ncbi:MAG: guanine deaminase [Bryobacteraceae bacterium]
MSRELFRAAIFHTPRNPFFESNALEVLSDGGLLVDGDRIAAIGDFSDVQGRNADAVVRDCRGGFLLPGFVDTHVHYPQIRVIGALGQSLLDWLSNSALPEEVRMSEAVYATQIAREFLHALAAHGTTTALVFGAHFQSAMEILFDQALASGLTIASGLIVSDRMLRPELHVSPEDAYRQSSQLIRRYHDRGALKYAVTPRFALSASEGILEVCQTLLRENAGLLFQTHMNENKQEIDHVMNLFPWAEDYLAVYEKFGLLGDRSVLAHNVWASDGALGRLASHGSSVSHCPCSNAALGSGFFSMRRHVAAGVRVALGTDVGGGTGFGMLKEGLQAYLLQRLASDCYPLTPAHMLYLATRAGAEALAMDETGDLSVGRYADFVSLRPPQGSVLESVCRNANSAEHVLASLFTLAGSESVAETWARGKRVYVQ